MEIYIDVIILENFIVNLFILLITLKIIREKIKNSRVIIAALIGAIYTIVLMIPKLKLFTTIPFILLVAFLMITISLNKTSFLKRLKSTGVFIITSVTLSGLCFMFSMWQNPYSMGSEFTISSYSLKYLIISLMIIYISYERITTYLREKSVVANFTFDLEITLDGVKSVVKGFLDTGNELREPVTNLPCIIIEENYLSSYVFREENAYYINYSAIGFSGKIKGFKSDNMRVRREGQDWRDVSAIICPCKDILSRENEFNALLSRGIV